MQGNGTEEVPFGIDQERVREGWEQAQALLDSADQQVRAAARTQPLAVIGGALVAGYLIGRLMARK